MDDCGHMLCTDCFPMYAQSKVMGADGVYALCPDQKCAMIVPPALFKKVLSEEEYEKYESFLLKSFVELSYNAKYCPGAGCQFIAANKTNREVDVECVCGTMFCFGCMQSPHPPINCELLDKWIQRTKNG